MVLAGGLCHFHCFMEVAVLFRRVNSPCQTTTESYFTSIVLLQTVYKHSIYYMTSSIFSVYTAGEFFFSDLTCELVVVIVSLFLQEPLFQEKKRKKKKKAFDSIEKKDRGPQPVDPSVKMLFKMGAIGSCL